MLGERSALSEGKGSLPYFWAEAERTCREGGAQRPQFQKQGYR